MDGKIHAGNICSCRLRFGAGGCSHLYILICNGIPAMSKIGFGKFLTGELWRPKMIFTESFQ